MSTSPDAPALDAERWLIGALLLDGAPVADVVRIVSPADFAEPRNRHLFEALNNLYARSEPIDFVTVGKELRRIGHFVEARARPYMVELAQGITTTAHARHHATLVAEHGRRLRAIELLRRGATDLEREPRGQSGAFLEGLIRELQATVAQAPGLGIEIVCMADVEARPLKWLWPGRVALGKVTLLVGDPGLGKSTLALDIAARVSRGETMPDSSETSPVGRVLIASAEDGLEDTIRPRLEAAGADLTRVEAILRVRDAEGERTFSLEEDLGLLDRKTGEIEGLRLLIIDPVTAYLGMTDSNNNADVRRVLAPLAALAERHQIAVVAISHLTKGQGPALYRALGSVAFMAAARAAWFVTKDKQDPGRRLFVQGKNNLGDAKALAFRVKLAPGPESTTVPRIDWEPEPVSITADEALAPETPGEVGQLERARDWLREALSSGPVEALTVIRDAAENNISKKTLYRAKDDLGARSKKTGTRGPWVWELGEGGQGCQDGNLATLGALDHLGPGEPENPHHGNGSNCQGCQDGQLEASATFGSPSVAGFALSLESSPAHEDAGDDKLPNIECCGSCGERDFVRPCSGGTWRCARCRPYDLPGNALEWWPRVDLLLKPSREMSE